MKANKARVLAEGFSDATWAGGLRHIPGNKTAYQKGYNHAIGMNRLNKGMN